MTETRLNYPVWRADLDIATKGQKEAQQPWTKKQFSDDITKLHRIRAHIKGKVHRQRARLVWHEQGRLGFLSIDKGWELATNGGSSIVKLHRSDEEKLLGDSWKKYAIEVEVIDHVQQRTIFRSLKRWLLG
jgi:hypothetical protein